MEIEGDGASPGDVVDAQGYMDANQGKIDRDAIGKIVAEYHELFLKGAPDDIAAGRLTPKLDDEMRTKLKKVCGGFLYEEDDAVLKATSPTGRIVDHV